MFKKLAIGLGSFIVIAAIVICAIPLKTVSYTVSVPYQDVENYTVYNGKNLFEDDTYFIRIGDYIAFREFLPCEVVPYEALVICGPQSSQEGQVVINDVVYCKGHVSCGGQVYWSIVETQGYDISFYVLDEENYNKWRQGQQYGIGYNDYEPRTGPMSGSEFTIPSPGYYYFVLSNSDTWIQYDKIVNLTASYYWEEVKQIIVTNQRPETRYKEVTLLDYCLHS